MSSGRADSTVELLVGDEPISLSNPMPTAPAPGAGDTVVDQGEAGTTPWKVDDDETQAAIALVARESGGNLAALAASASVLDDWDESDRAKVNPVAGQAGVAAGAGAVDAKTQRTTLASDDPSVAVLGALADAGVSTDANGSISAKLRGLIILFVNFLTRLPTSLGVSGGLKVESAVPLAANILNARVQTTSTTAATDLITIPAGRTWKGVLAASCASSVIAGSATAGSAAVSFSTAGTNVVPAAGIIFTVDCRVGANNVTGLDGAGAANFGSLPVVIIAPAGNAVTVQYATTNTGTLAITAATAFGMLL